MGYRLMTESISALSIVGLSKRFGSTKVLDSVDLTVNYGEVHGLLGENGSGKSTIIKILAGLHICDSGTVSIKGKKVDLPMSASTRALYRLTFVHQNLGLIPSLTVTENMLLDNLAVPEVFGYGFNLKREHKAVSEIFQGLRIDINPRSLVSRLSQLDRTRIAIARAAWNVGLVELGTKKTRGILVLDEPTASLSKDEASTLFKWVRQFANFGGAVLFVSHHLEEVLALTDRVTIIRDGRKVITQTTKTLSKEQLIHLILGRPICKVSSSAWVKHEAEPLVKVKDLRSETVESISFDVNKGEIVGITGPLGSGVDSIPYLLSGASPALSGTITLGTQTVELRVMSPYRSVKMGIALIPANRTREGIVGSLSIAENIELPFRTYGSNWFSDKLLRSKAFEKMRIYDVRPLNPKYETGKLSGGNQQKGIIARWFSTNPLLVLLCHPTQGVDVGARQQIYSSLKALSPKAAVVMLSVDYEELEQLCDRVLIIDKGRLITELTGEDVSTEVIASACLEII